MRMYNGLGRSMLGIGPDIAYKFGDIVMITTRRHNALGTGTFAKVVGVYDRYTTYIDGDDNRMSGGAVRVVATDCTGCSITRSYKSNEVFPISVKVRRENS